MRKTFLLVALALLAVTVSAGVTCRSDAECIDFEGRSYHCVNPGTEESYCEVEGLCKTDGDCTGGVCCSDEGLCEKPITCKSDADCPDFEEHTYHCVNPGTCDSYCEIEGLCKSDGDCKNDLCCSDRGLCEKPITCKSDADCPSFQNRDYHCVNPNTCDSYCEVNEEDIEKGCDEEKGEYPTNVACRLYCNEPKECVLNEETSCWECIELQVAVTAPDTRQLAEIGQALEGKQIPPPFSWVYNDETVKVEIIESKIEALAVIRDGRIEDVHMFTAPGLEPGAMPPTDLPTENIEITIKVKMQNLSPITDISESEDPLGELKLAMEDGRIEVDPVGVWGEIKFFMTRLFLGVID